ncbi:MAG TPA: L-threonylcarbamoyladenylate synthase [Candidatus Udaeobacter sp.]|nr:L-threonylcarbamoyladenylate synthase [Candidatus Udaeobacter sp.]
MKTETVAATYDRRGRHQTAATERAVELLRAGEVVALPTETVYGLAADALNPSAVAKIFEAKERPRFDPLIVHLPDKQWLERVAKVDNYSRARIERVIEQFWPGPLTLILDRQPIVPEIVTAGLSTVAVRMSSHPIFVAIISAFGKPVAAPSANRFGRISPTTAQHVLDELDGRIPLIIDAGPTTHGIESTIIAFRDKKIDVLRRGPITTEQLTEFGEIDFVSPPQKVSSPGQLPLHYAPKTPLCLIENAKSFPLVKNNRVGLLAWNASIPKKRFAAVRTPSERQDLREAAANLFHCLRELDELHLDLIVAERVPARGLGAAILDRLERASHGSDIRDTHG